MEIELIDGLTSHEKKAKVLGIHPHTLAMMQRRNAVPKDIRDFTADHDVVVFKIAQVISDPEFLRSQLARKMFDKRKELVAAAGDFLEFKRWERLALDIYSVIYRERKAEGKTIGHDDTVYVKAYLNRLCNVDFTRQTNRERLQELRRRAAARVDREAPKNENQETKPEEKLAISGDQG